MTQEPELSTRRLACRRETSFPGSRIWHSSSRPITRSMFPSRRRKTAGSEGLGNIQTSASSEASTAPRAGGLVGGISVVFPVLETMTEILAYHAHRTREISKDMDRRV